MDILYLNGGPLETSIDTAAEWEVKKLSLVQSSDS